MKRWMLVLAACGSKPPITMPAPPAVEQAAPTPPTQEAKPMPPPVPTQTATPQTLAFPNEEFRAHQPAAGAPHPFKLPPVHELTLANGVKVYLVEQHTLPIVSMDLNFDGGSIADPKGK